MKKIISIFCIGGALAPLFALSVFSPSTCVLEWKQTKELLEDQNYQAAFNLSCKNAEIERARQSVIYLEKYDDLGAEKDLKSADSLLNQSEFSWGKDEQSVFWEGFSDYQRGYVLAVKKSEFKAGLKTRSGALKLENSSFAEAQIFFLVYQYYKAKMTDWLPFKESQAQKTTSAIQSQLKSSSLFYNQLSTSLIWILFDQKRFAEALSVVKNLEANAPKNRVIQQIYGDLLRHSKQIPLAMQVYQKNEQEYRRLAPYSVRHLSAMANLLILQKMTNGAKHPFTEEFLKELPKQKKRMPSSLMDELKKQGIFN